MEPGPGRDLAYDEYKDSDIEAAEEAPIVRMANAILATSIEQGASDIHIEPDRKNVRIRIRIDGVMQHLMTVPKHIQAAMISRYKIMADMNISERRVPQDGRIPFKHGEKNYDMRVSCLPSLHGEKLVMRILDQSSVLIGLNKIGLEPDMQAILEELVTKPTGMLLVTGPTGSGKTTTLYSLLNKINNIEKNIITVEDPVEYQLGGLTQVQIDEKVGRNSETVLRSILRQDPDIIMVGEMRDQATAKIAIQAAMTGHLVLSTLHTNDATSAVTRLADMGVDPFLISATVVGVLAQRLARKVCANCKEAYEAPISDLSKFGFKPDDINAQTITLYRGRGCNVCRQKGYKGRLGIYSLMRTNEKIADLITRSVSLKKLRKAARAYGMQDLLADGLKKILAGVTTPEEVMRVVNE